MSPTRFLPIAPVILATILVGQAHPAASTFDHTYASYAALLQQNLRGSRVDYARLRANRQSLDDVAESFDAVDARGEAGWTRPERLAFWINAYNVFTLRAIVDHYPIRGRWLSLYPKNSIRQIDGVWSELTWGAAGRRVTLDQIEHEILRQTLREPLIHFAVNCASIGCPPLAAEPYRPATILDQLEAAARRYFASPYGLVVDGRTIRLSGIFDWYGEDFVERFGTAGAARRTGRDRALLGLVASYGPPEAAAAARRSETDVAFLDYDWSLNDVEDASR